MTKAKLLVLLASLHEGEAQTKRRPSVILTIYFILSIILVFFLLLLVGFIRMLWADSGAVEIDLYEIEGLE
jgi:hypothetical protein